MRALDFSFAAGIIINKSQQVATSSLEIITITAHGIGWTQQRSLENYKFPADDCWDGWYSRCTMAKIGGIVQCSALNFPIRPHPTNHSANLLRSNRSQCAQIGWNAAKLSEMKWSRTLTPRSASIDPIELIAGSLARRFSIAIELNWLNPWDFDYCWRAVSHAPSPHARRRHSEANTQTPTNSSNKTQSFGSYHSADFVQFIKHFVCSVFFGQHRPNWRKWSLIGRTCSDKTTKMHSTIATFICYPGCSHNKHIGPVLGPKHCYFSALTGNHGED